MTLRPWAALVLLTGCQLLTLSELEKKSPSSCSATAPCASGWVCGGDGLCHEDTGGACREGDMMACGMTQGECEAGTQVCKSGAYGACVGAVGPVTEVCDGKDNDCDGPADEDAVDAPACPLDAGVCAGKRAGCGGTCTATTYGADYEAGPESRCDGRDNDCDGQTDEGLSQLCTEQRGECAGARAACAGGVFPACGQAQFAPNDADWEAYETKCDGKDNDCDGRTDAWAASNVSGSAGRSRFPAAVRAAPASADLVVFWEEEEPPSSGNFKVRSRVVRQDNTMSPIVTPATTVAASARSGLPAVAGDGTELVAAWAEEATLGGVLRVVVISVDAATGASKLAAMGSLNVLSSPQLSQPTELAIAVDAAAQRALVAVSNGLNVDLVMLNLPVGGATRVAMDVAALSTGVRLAPAGGGRFWITYTDSVGRVDTCLVHDDASLTRTCNQGPFGNSPAITPLTSAAPFAAVSTYIQYFDGGVASSTCVDGGTCSAPVPVAAIGSRAAMKAFQASATARNAPPSFFAWEQGDAGSEQVLGVATGSDAGVISAGAGKRPQPLFLGPGRGAIVYDNADDIFVARYCL